jgi:hypothetical protein
MVKERMPALEGVLELIHANRLVGRGEMHRSVTEHEFIRELVSHREFAAGCLVIEFGNALYQELLDAYIGGEEVPPAEIRQVSLNTTQSAHQQRGDPWDAVIYAELLATIRGLNRAGRCLRVLAGDPPVDWSNVENRDDLSRLRPPFRLLALRPRREPAVLGHARPRRCAGYLSARSFCGVLSRPSDRGALRRVLRGLLAQLDALRWIVVGADAGALGRVLARPASCSLGRVVAWDSCGTAGRVSAHRHVASSRLLN